MPHEKTGKKHAKKGRRKHRKAQVLALNTLPTPVLQNIFRQLSFADVTELLLVNKHLASLIASDPEYWKEAHLKHFRLETFDFLRHHHGVIDWHAQYRTTYEKSYHSVPLPPSRHTKRTFTLIKSGDLARLKTHTTETGFSLNDLRDQTMIDAIAACPNQAMRDYLFDKISPQWYEKDTNKEPNLIPISHLATLLNQRAAIRAHKLFVPHFRIVDKDRRLPLNYAILSGNARMVKLLISHMGHYLTDTNAALDIDNIEPLQMAARLQYLDIVEVLVAHGLDPNGVFRGIPYLPPLIIAAMYGNHALAAYLLSQGADVNITASFPSYDLREMRSAIHLATNNEDLNMLKLLLANGADTEDMQNTDGTPLMLAVLQQSYQTAQCLLEHKANPNTANKNNAYPIDAAAKTNNLPMLELLLKYGAIVDRKHGESARYFAKTSPEMTKTLHHAQLKQYIATNPNSLFAATALKAVVEGKAEISTLKKYRRTLSRDKNLKEIYEHVRHP